MNNGAPKAAPASGTPGAPGRAPITMDMDTGVPPKRRRGGRQGVPATAALPKRKVGMVRVDVG